MLKIKQPRRLTVQGQPQWGLAPTSKFDQRQALDFYLSALFSFVLEKLISSSYLKVKSGNTPLPCSRQREDKGLTASY